MRNNANLLWSPHFFALAEPSFRSTGPEAAGVRETGMSQSTASCAQPQCRQMTMTMTMTLKEDRPTVVRGLALQAWRSQPREKESVRAGVACSVGKICICTRINDSVQYIGSR